MGGWGEGGMGRWGDVYVAFLSELDNLSKLIWVKYPSNLSPCLRLSASPRL
ncbi:MAG: hypothetical protein F6K58_31695 [Symploca sp. SIO2E9]|nr:hypothetical protein [Symploca sp. SIO2E9]